MYKTRYLWITIKNELGDKKKCLIGKMFWDGVIDGVVFAKDINHDKHVMHTMEAIGIDAKKFKKDIVHEAKEVRVYVDGKKYTTTPDYLREHGEYRHFKAGGWDYGAQIFLPISQWN